MGRGKTNRMCAESIVRATYINCAGVLLDHHGVLVNILGMNQKIGSSDESLSKTSTQVSFAQLCKVLLVAHPAIHKFLPVFRGQIDNSLDRS
jgi:hypothetical protein